MAYYDQVTNRQGQAAGSQPIDLRKRYNRGLGGSVDAQASYLRSPEFQEYANPEQLVQTQGTDSIFAGARSAQRDAALSATQAGLGRGAAAQFRTNINQQAMGAVSNALLSAKLLGGERRAMGAMSLADAIKNYQTQLALRRIQHRNTSMTSLFQGNLASQFGSQFGQGIGSGAGQLAAGLGRLGASGAGALGGLL